MGRTRGHGLLNSLGQHEWRRDRSRRSAIFRVIEKLVVS